MQQYIFKNTLMFMKNVLALLTLFQWQQSVFIGTGLFP